MNCHFGPFESLDCMQKMADVFKSAGIKKHMMIQPLGYHTPDAKRQGFIDLPEFPFALEPRICTRWDMHKYARQAFDMGIRFIGGCCGYEPYHIRAIAEELSQERGKQCAGSQKHDLWGKGLELHTKPWVRARAHKGYWKDIKPSSGRPACASMSVPDQWGVTAGHEMLKQHAAKTTKEEIAQVTKHREEVKTSKDGELR